MPKKMKNEKLHYIISYLLLHDEIKQFHTLLAQTPLSKFPAERYISDRFSSFQPCRCSTKLHQ